MGVIAGESERGMAARARASNQGGWCRTKHPSDSGQSGRGRRSQRVGSGSVHEAPVRHRACPGTRASCEEALRLVHRLSFEDEVDRAGDLVREDGEALGLAVTFGELGAIEFGVLVLS